MARAPISMDELTRAFGRPMDPNAIPVQATPQPTPITRGLIAPPADAMPSQQGGGLLSQLFGARGSEDRLRLKMGLMGMTYNPNQALMQQWGSDIQTIQDKRTTREANNRTAAWLHSNGRADLAAALETGAISAKDAVTQFYDDKARAEKTAAGGDVTYGLTPQPYRKPDGTIGMFVLGTDGQPKDVPVPNGGEFAVGTDKIDTGTEIITTDKFGNELYRTPKNNEAAAADTARGTEIGKAEGTALINAGPAVAKAESFVKLIDEVISDPALPSVTGMIQGRLPAIPLISGGQAGANLNVKIAQIKGKAFLEAYDALRGSGAITEQEGAAATAAKARLDQAQDDVAYTQALIELKAEVLKLAEIAKAKAAAAGGGSPTVNPQQPQQKRGQFNPATGQVEWN